MKCENLKEKKRKSLTKSCCFFLSNFIQSHLATPTRGLLITDFKWTKSNRLGGARPCKIFVTMTEFWWNWTQSQTTEWGWAMYRFVTFFIFYKDWIWVITRKKFTIASLWFPYFKVMLAHQRHILLFFSMHLFWLWI